MLMKPHMKVVYNLEEGAATDAGILSSEYQI
jgi:hypothetical protein